MKWRGPQRRAPKNSSYAGYAMCLRCDREFQSWDRRHNRLCPRCKSALDQEPSEETEHVLPMPLRRSRLREDG